MAQNVNNDMIDLEDMQGKWFVVRSDFAMWTKGDKTNPSLNYLIKKKGKRTGWMDIVVYLKKGKQKKISGFDTSQNSENTQFIWRGKGLLKLIKSKWGILYLDRNKQWAIIHFEKTLFTSAGYDVISRNKKMDAATEKKCLDKLAELNVTSKLTLIHQD